VDPEQKRLLSELQAASAAFRAEAEHIFTFAGRFAQDEAVKVLRVVLRRPTPRSGMYSINS
jgi:hypothetical protein